MSRTADIVWFAIFAVAIVLVVTRRDLGQGNLRGRLDRFARRENLVVTRTNEPVVVYYLVMTRRWRQAAFLAAAVVSGSVAIATSTTASPLWLPAGWFGGVALAEWRVFGAVAGSRAAASLRPRQLTDYVGRTVVGAILAVWILVPILAFAGLLATAAHRPFQRVGECVVLGVVVLGFPLFVVAVRHVVSRPQPLAHPDVIAADNAIRRRSLNVFAGSLLAIGGLLVTSAVIAGLATRPSGIANLTIVIFGVALPIVGFLVATKPRRTPTFGVLRAVGA